MVDGFKQGESGHEIIMVNPSDRDWTKHRFVLSFGVRGRIIGYRAEIGPIEVIGSSPKDATEKCERLALAALERLRQGTTIRRWRGHIIVMEPTEYGWSYWVDTASDTSYRVMTSTTPSGTREHAFDSALKHLFHSVWQHDSDDAAMLASVPPSLRADLARWIGFQRAYKRHRDAGRPEIDCHRLACESPDAVAYDAEARVA